MQKGENKMCGRRTKEEYIRRYARDYCNGNEEEAKKHAMVKEAVKYLPSEEGD